MKKNQKRYLTHYFPEILGHKNLPVIIQHAQFYAMDIRNDEESIQNVPFDEHFNQVKISAYQTNHFQVFNTLGKPISKIIR